MEWIAAAIAAVSALAAIWQAAEARRARNDARASSDSAAAHEQRAVEAAERQALVAEEDLAMKRAAAEEYKDPWQFTRLSKERWQLTLVGNEEVVDLRIDQQPDGADIDLVDEPKPVMHPGESLFLVWGKTFGSPSAITIEARWKRPGRPEEHVWRATVM